MDRLPTPKFLGVPCDSASKESACNVEDLGLILGWERFPGEGNSYPLKYSGLENSMGCIVHEVGHNWVISLHFDVQSCVVWWSPTSLVCFGCFVFAVKSKKKKKKLLPRPVPSLGSHKVGHDWSDLAAVAAARPMSKSLCSMVFSTKFLISR